MPWPIYYAALTVVSLKPEKKTREATKSRTFLAKIKMLALFRRGWDGWSLNYLNKIHRFTDLKYKDKKTVNVLQHHTKSAAQTCHTIW